MQTALTLTSGTELKPVRWNSIQLWKWFMFCRPYSSLFYAVQESGCSVVGFRKFMQFYNEIDEL